MTIDSCSLLSKFQSQQVHAQVANLTTRADGQQVFEYRNFVVDSSNSSDACANAATPYRCVVEASVCSACQSVFIRIVASSGSAVVMCALVLTLSLVMGT